MQQGIISKEYFALKSEKLDSLPTSTIETNPIGIDKMPNALAALITRIGSRPVSAIRSAKTETTALTSGD